MNTPSAQPLAPSASKRFRIEAPLGDLAIQRGFVTQPQVNECLTLQAELKQKGQNPFLGDLLVENGYLLAHQLKALLKEQEGAPSREYIKNYKLMEQLGQGGMGTVLKARRDDGLIVAVKLLFERHAADSVYITRFRREAELCAQLDHPHVVKCLEYGEADGFHFMALEYVDGEDLGKFLARRNFFPEAQALAILLAAARGMAAAHALGMVHRDIKPANIMLTREGGVKVMDFGLARVGADLALEQNLTVTGILMGTPQYMSPEQVRGQKELDPRSDIYGLGATFFHMLTGRPPFVSGNLYELLTSHLSKPVPDPRHFNPEISEEVVQLVRWMCARELNERLPSAERLAQETAKLLGLPSAGGGQKRTSSRRAGHGIPALTELPEHGDAAEAGMGGHVLVSEAEAIKAAAEFLLEFPPVNLIGDDKRPSGRLADGTAPAASSSTVVANVDSTARSAAPVVPPILQPPADPVLELNRVRSPDENRLKIPPQKRTTWQQHSRSLIWLIGAGVIILITFGIMRFLWHLLDK